MRACLTLAVALMAACCSSESTPIRNFSSPGAGVHTSGQPTESQFAALRSMGITRVITLRLAGEKGTGWEEGAARELDLDFVRLPIAPAKDLTRASVDKFAAELAKKGEASTLVCCGSSDRVGALFALKAFWIDQQDKDAALAVGRAAGLNRLEPRVAALMK